MLAPTNAENKVKFPQLNSQKWFLCQLRDVDRYMYRRMRTLWCITC